MARRRRRKKFGKQAKALPVPVEPKKQRIGFSTLQQKGLEIIKSKAPVRVAVEKGSGGKIYDFNKGGWCSAYATRAAETVFGLHYAKGNAWNLAILPGNNLVQRLAKQTPNGWERHGADLKKIEQQLLPGRLVGIYFPWSPNNRPERPYTHVALYLGAFEGKHWVMHNIHGPKIDALEDITTKMFFRGTIVDIIQPAKK